MAGDNERAAYAQWILERNLDWISHAEVKAAFIVTLDVAMVTALAATFMAVPEAERTGLPSVFTIITSGLLVVAIACATMSVLPRTGGPKTSFIFFGKVGTVARADFVDSFQRATPEALLNDLLDQIHRNAEIACEKFAWVKRAMYWSLIALIPFVLAISYLTKVLAK
jgi:hypothetical protein